MEPEQPRGEQPQGEPAQPRPEQTDWLLVGVLIAAQLLPVAYMLWRPQIHGLMSRLWLRGRRALVPPVRHPSPADVSALHAEAARILRGT